MPIEDMQLLSLARTPPRRPHILRIETLARKNNFISARAAWRIRYGDHVNARRRDSIWRAM